MVCTTHLMMHELSRLQETHLAPYLVKGRDVATRGHLKLRVASFALANIHMYIIV